MLFRNISVLDENFDIKKGMFVGVKDDKIIYVGEKAPEETLACILGSEVYDGAGKLMMSGFYNTHGHSIMTLMRGYGEELSLKDWLDTKILPFEDRLDGNSAYWGTTLAIAESLKSGIVSTSDMYYFCPDVAKAALDAGVKMNIARSFVHFDDSDPRETYRFREMTEFVRDFNMTGMGRIVADMSLHAVYTNTEKSIAAAAEACADAGARMQIHISETERENANCMKWSGKSPVKLCADLGVFDVPTTAAHCVWLSDEDMDILAAKGVFVSTCPASNMKLASGIANVPAMLGHGICVSLGTDGAASNNSLNFFEEMKLMALAASARAMDPTAISVKDVLRIATVNGARAQGRKDCGAVKAGNKADVIILDLESPNMHPAHNIQANAVYAASDSNVVLTMVDGKVLYRDGEFKTIDIEKALFEAESAVSRILGEL